MLTWQPSTVAQVEETRRRRRVQRLEQRLNFLRKRNRELFQDDISKLQSELATLQRQAGTG